MICSVFVVIVDLLCFCSFCCCCCCKYFKLQLSHKLIKYSRKYVYNVYSKTNNSTETITTNNCFLCSSDKNISTLFVLFPIVRICFIALKRKIPLTFTLSVRWLCFLTISLSLSFSIFFYYWLHFLLLFLDGSVLHGQKQNESKSNCVAILQRRVQREERKEARRDFNILYFFFNFDKYIRIFMDTLFFF